MADQAAYISQESAQKAVEIIKQAKKIKSYCAPCGDEKAETIRVDEVKAKYTNYENFWEVFLTYSPRINSGDSGFRAMVADK